MSKSSKKTSIDVVTKIMVIELSQRGLTSNQIQTEIAASGDGTRSISATYVRAIVRAAHDGGYFPEGEGAASFEAIRQFAENQAIETVVERSGVDRDRAEKLRDIVKGGLVPVVSSGAARSGKKPETAPVGAPDVGSRTADRRSAGSGDGRGGVDILLGSGVFGRIDFASGRDEVALGLMRGVWDVLGERRATEVGLSVSGPIGQFAKDVSAEALRHARETGERVGIEIVDAGLRYYANPD